MSRIGKQPIIIPDTVTVEKQVGTLLVKGPKGELVVKLPVGVTVSQEGNMLKVEAAGAIAGLGRSIVANAVHGVTTGFTKTLEIRGTGFKAAVTGNALVLNLGFSHAVNFPTPIGIAFAVNGLKIVVSGVDRQQVGEITAQVRRIKTPDHYKGKGIRYDGEVVKLKPGKAAKTAGGAAGAK